jgi:hypothetical protein
MIYNKGRKSMSLNYEEKRRMERLSRLEKEKKAKSEESLEISRIVSGRIAIGDSISIKGLERLEEERRECNGKYRYRWSDSLLHLQSSSVRN